MNNPITKCIGGSGMHERTSLQIMYPFYALQNSYETENFKELWKLENYKKTYGIRFVQPVLTLQEHAGVEVVQFVEKNEGFLKLATYLRSKERQQNQAQMSIITDFLDLINSDIIITHIHFILGFYKSFFKQHYDILKSIDKITKTVGCMSRNNVVEAFSTHTDIQ